MQDHKRDNIFQKLFKKQPSSGKHQRSASHESHFPPQHKRNGHVVGDSGMVFYSQHLGTQLQSREPDLDRVSTIVKRMLNHSKSSGRKLPKYAITVSSKYVKLQSEDTSERPAVIPIHCVQYCASDVVNPKVFVFIANTHQAFQVNVFCCSKKAKAEALTIAFAKSFKQSYGEWEDKLKDQVDKQGQLRARTDQMRPMTPRGSMTSSSGSSTPPSPHSPMTPRSTGSDDDIKPTKPKGIALFDMYAMHHEYRRRESVFKQPSHLKIGNDYQTLSRSSEVKKYLQYGDSDPDEEWSQYSY
ncbi:uncharacterized protein LOC100369200 [Saccoglossus kowalevskii]|uniref:Low density lipoprotein receptor adapter protein 1-like n=1 Tax=Saccoglossus kowalevskii TaxID=10224 RepID=A0ABM0GYJ3_SACKO|nr:PREDICTED: low density lipoprotein receptor adapter protein 1-like [Saccoglossus kowalevskii]